MSQIKGRLVPLWAALDPDLQLVGLIPMLWQNGTIILWGRRKGHAMPEPIEDYRGLVIDWAGGPAKGDYPSEAYAHPKALGADYYNHEWKDLAIPESDLDRLRAGIERDDSTAARPERASAEQSDNAERNSITRATSEKPEIGQDATLADAALLRGALHRKLPPAIEISPSVERLAELPIQEAEQTPAASPREAPRGGARSYRAYLPSAFMPEGYIPILEAASLLAFDDPEFLDHIPETQFVPQIGRASLVTKESCPEIYCHLDRLINKHTVGEIVIIGRRRTVPEWRNQVRHSDPMKGEICNKYDMIPSDHFRFNDWSFESLDPFGLTALGGDPFGAEWFYPAVELSDVERIRGATGQAATLEWVSDMAERQVAGKGGRKPGSGAIDDEDALRGILAQGKAPSVFAAAGMVAKADGVGGASIESAQRRLSRKFTDRHGTEPPSGKTWSDIVG